MKLLLFETSPESRAVLLGRVQEGARQADLRRIEVYEGDFEKSDEHDWSLVIGCVIGPGWYPQIEETVSQLRSLYPSGPIAVILPPETYSAEAVTLRRRLNVQIIALSDLAQIANFLIDCDTRAGGGGGSVRNRGIIGVCQIKGGVGTTTLCAALAACWAKHGLSTAAVDFDDVSPQLTAWGRVGVAQRGVTSELLHNGEVPASRINELVNPVEGFEGRLVVVGQPDAYNESFHFKANVLEGAPSAGDFVRSLVENFKNEFDVIIFDLARSWGVGTFSALPLCTHVLLVTDDDGMSVRRTLDGLARLKRESDDDQEFNLSKWSLILNSYTGRLISPKDVVAEIQEMELFPPESNLWTVPFSESGRQWGAPGQSMYELCDQRTRDELRKIAHSLVPFRFEREPGLHSKLLKRWQALVQTQ